MYMIYLRQFIALYSPFVINCWTEKNIYIFTAEIAKQMAVLVNNSTMALKLFTQCTIW